MMTDRERTYRNSDSSGNRPRQGTARRGTSSIPDVGPGDGRRASGGHERRQQSGRRPSGTGSHSSRPQPSRQRSGEARRRPANDVEIIYPDGYRPIDDRDRDARGDTRFYRSRRDEDEESSRSIFKILITIVASIIYWPIAIIGVVSPFMEGFNPGGLAMWQVVFSRFWLAFILLGAVYALVVNLGNFRHARFFRGRNKVLRIIVFLLADLVISFIVIRLVCLF